MARAGAAKQWADSDLRRPLVPKWCQAGCFGLAGGANGAVSYTHLDVYKRQRKEMDLFSNLRPAQCFDALADFSSLKKEVVAGLDIVIVRELTSGVYFGEPRGIFVEGNQRVGINTQRYTCLLYTSRCV